MIRTSTCTLHVRGTSTVIIILSRHSSKSLSHPSTISFSCLICLWRSSFWQRRYPFQQFGLPFIPPLLPSVTRLPPFSCSPSLLPLYLIHRVHAVMTLHDLLRSLSSIFMNMSVWVSHSMASPSMSDFLALPLYQHLFFSCTLFIYISSLH